MSNYEDGFAEGIRYYKDELLEWAETYTFEDYENYQKFYELLIEKLEQ